MGYLSSRYECGGNTRYEYHGTCTCKEQYYVYPGAKGRRNDSDRCYPEGVKYVLLYAYQGMSFSINGNASKDFGGTRTASEVIH